MHVPTSITFTGIDDEVSQGDLVRIAQACPAWLGLEFAIQHDGAGDGVTGRPGFPSPRGMASLVRKVAQLPQVGVALHLCGEDAIDGFLKDREPVYGLVRMGGFQRIQLNVRPTPHAVPDVRRAIMGLRGAKVITPHHAGHAALAGALWDCENHEILFDDSQGRDVLPAFWRAPMPGKRCGYAGGLSPDTLEDALYGLAAVIREPRGVWIDVGVGVRDEQDRFSPDLAIAAMDVMGRLRSRF